MEVLLEKNNELETELTVVVRALELKEISEKATGMAEMQL